MGSKGRERVEAEYSWSQVVEKIESIYEQVLKGGIARTVA